MLPEGSERAPDPAREAEPSLEGAFAPDGVDLTLIRWMLERSPTERLLAAQAMLDVTLALHGSREA